MSETKKGLPQDPDPFKAKAEEIMRKAKEGEDFTAGEFGIMSMLNMITIGFKSGIKNIFSVFAGEDPEYFEEGENPEDYQ